MMAQRIVAFALNALAGIILLGLLAGCAPPQPSPSALADQLNHCLIRVDALPPGPAPGLGWMKLNGPERQEPQDLPRRAMAGQAIEFGNLPSRAHARHLVLLYPSEAKAAADYVRGAADDFYDAERLTPWQAPSLPGYQNQGASESRLACAEFRGVDRDRLTFCNIRARYGRYLSTFHTWLGPDYMSLEDLSRVLKAVDERMSACSAQ